MKLPFNGWTAGFLRWVAIVGPILVALVWLDGRYITRADVLLMKESAEHTHTALADNIVDVRASQDQIVVQLSQLRDALNRNSEALAHLNGVLEAQKRDR